LRVEPITGEFVEAKLWQGNPSGTLIATHTFFPSTAWLDEFYQLSEAEAQSITDWTDLYVSLVLESTPPSNELRITQVYLEAPDGTFSSSVTARATASASCRRIRLGSSSVNAVAAPTANCVRLRQGGASPVLAVATASQPNPMLILRDRAHGAAQVLRPISDVSNAGNWVNEVGSFANLALSIDEAKPDDDVTWVETFFFGAFGSEFTVALAPGVDPLRDADHTLFFRAKKTWVVDSSGIVQLFVTLIDGLTNNVIHSGGVLLETVYQDFVIRIPESSAAIIQGSVTESAG